MTKTPLGYTDGPVFTNEQIDTLIEIAGSKPHNGASALSDMLNALNSRMAMMLALHKDPRHGQDQLRQLEYIHSSAVGLEKQLISYSDSYGPMTIRMELHACQNLVNSVWCSLERLRAVCKSGRPSHWFLNQAAMDLIWVWEQWTGTKFVVSRKKGSDVPVRFVEAALKMLASEAKENEIGTAIRNARQRLNVMKNSAHPSRQKPP
jgi:hypothetical protein